MNTPHSAVHHGEGTAGIRNSLGLREDETKTTAILSLTAIPRPRPPCSSNVFEIQQVVDRSRANAYFFTSCDPQQCVAK